MKKLDRIVDYQWHEISDALPKIESLVDEDTFPERALPEERRQPYSS